MSEFVTMKIEIRGFLNKDGSVEVVTTAFIYPAEARFNGAIPEKSEAHFPDRHTATLVLAKTLEAVGKENPSLTFTWMEKP